MCLSQNLVLLLVWANALKRTTVVHVLTIISIYCTSSSGKQLERKFSEQNISAPPSYEEAVGEARSPTQSERY